MRQLQRLSIISVLSLAPAIAMGAPPQDQSQSNQGQSLDGRTQSQGQNTQSQANPPSPPPGPYGPPTIEVNPQIQVQVNPDLNVEAKPQADADADADAKADVQANPKSEAKADVDTDIKSEVQMDTASDGGTAQVAPAPEAPPKKVTKVKIIHRAVPPHAAPKPLPPPKRRSGLMVAGIFTFGGSYIATAFNGAYIYENCHRAANEAACRQIGTKMLIPVAGPFMAIKDSEVTSNRVKLGALGGLQTAGAAMAVLGTIMHVRDGKNARVNHNGVRIGKRTRVAPMAGAQGGGLNMNLRF